jgi:hypothetical protein
MADLLVTPADRHEPPFAREGELRRLDALLAVRRAALAVVVGPPGSGKSTLLGKLDALASAHGWRVPRPFAGDLTVGPSTSVAHFAGELQRLLDAYAVGGLPWAPGWPFSPGGSMPAAGSGTGAPAPETALVDDLGAAPTLIIVDDYNPAPPFARWFEHSFLQALGRAEAPVVTVVSTRPGANVGVLRLADAVVELDALDDRFVRAAIKAAATGLEPPLESEELDTYVEAASREPEVFDGLLRVFGLATDALRRQAERRGHDA